MAKAVIARRRVEAVECTVSTLDWSTLEYFLAAKLSTTMMTVWKIGVNPEESLKAHVPSKGERRMLTSLSVSEISGQIVVYGCANKRSRTGVRKIFWWLVRKRFFLKEVCKNTQVKGILL